VTNEKVSEALEKRDLVLHLRDENFKFWKKITKVDAKENLGAVLLLICGK
jgi:hypothetical protein